MRRIQSLRLGDEGQPARRLHRAVEEQGASHLAPWIGWFRLKCFLRDLIRVPPPPQVQVDVEEPEPRRRIARRFALPALQDVDLAVEILRFPKQVGLELRYRRRRRALAPSLLAESKGISILLAFKGAARSGQPRVQSTQRRFDRSYLVLRRRISSHASATRALRAARNQRERNRGHNSAAS